VLNPFEPYDNAAQLTIAFKLSVPVLRERSLVAAFALQKNNQHYSEGSGFKNLADYYRKLDAIEQRGGSWFQASVAAWEGAPNWMPLETPFQFKDTMAVLKDLVGDPRYVEHLKWGPQKLYDAKGIRVYTDIYTGNWWPRVQVCTL
jgi:Plavaka transposase